METHGNPQGDDFTTQTWDRTFGGCLMFGRGWFGAPRNDGFMMVNRSN